MRLCILSKEAGARIDIETIEIGEKVYLSGNAAGIVGFSAAHESLFKSPDYQHRKGGGYSSLNVAVRKILSRASAVILSKP